MKFVRRSEWGAPVSAAAYIAGTKGSKVHYLGTPFSSRSHDRCADYVRSIRASHLANTAENYSDIAYNMLVCEHGYVYEGRGVHKRTGANGNATLNSQHYAVCALLGSSGLTEPTDAMLHGIRDAIEYLREHGNAGSEIKGHRDGYATSCPGDPLYAWVKKGAPRPGSTTPQPTEPPKEETDMTPEQAAQLAEIRKLVAYGGWDYKGKTALDGQPETQDAYSYLRGTKADVDALESKVAQLTAKVDALQTTGLTDAQMTALADKVADALHSRLAD